MGLGRPPYAFTEQGVTNHTESHRAWHLVTKEIEWELPLDEQAINAIVVQTMTEGRQLIIMDDAD